jgi:hypothetical protein
MATSLHIVDDVLHWLFSVVGDEATTLETGCGATTVAFLAENSYHTVISPLAKERERIEAWRGSHGFSTEPASVIPATSGTVLPTMDPTSPGFGANSQPDAFWVRVPLPVHAAMTVILATYVLGPILAMRPPARYPSNLAVLPCYAAWRLTAMGRRRPNAWNRAPREMVNREGSGS